MAAASANRISTMPAPVGDESATGVLASATSGTADDAVAGAEVGPAPDDPV
jgi:hypothetical protein